MRQVNCADALAALHEGFTERPAEWGGDTAESRTVIHTFLGFIGADWDRDEAVRAIHENGDRLHVVDPDTFAWKMNHRLVILNWGKSGSPLFMETRAGAFEAAAS